MAIGSKIEGAGTKLLPVSAGIAALGTTAVKTTADFDNVMSKVSAVSGATGDDLQKLRDKAREMGSQTKFSATEAGEAMNYMAMAGWKTEDMISGIEGIMNLAAASGEDLATTSDIVTDALTAFGLSAADSGHFADILAAASSNANTNVSLMGETFKYTAPIAGALGFSAEDTAEAIGIMANAGIKGSQSGTSLRSIMTALAGEVKFCSDAFGVMEIATTNQDGSMRELNDIFADCRVAFAQMSESEKAANAQAIAGKEAMSGFLALMNAAPADTEKLSSAINNCDGTAAKMAETMQDNLSGKITILKSQLQELAISLGEIIMPVIIKIVEIMQELANKLNALSPEMRETIVKIGLIAAAIAPVLIITGKIISSVGTIITLIPKITNAVSAVISGIEAFNAVLLANPMPFIIAAIIALVAAIVYLWNNCESFRTFWHDYWESIQETLYNFFEAWEIGWKAIKDFFSNLWNNFQQDFQTGIDIIVNTFSGFRTFFSTLIDLIFSVTENTMRNLRDTVLSIWDVVRNGVASRISGVQEAVTDGIGSAAEYVTDIVNSAWEWGHDLIQNLINGIRSRIDSLVDTVAGVANSISEYLHFSVPDKGPLASFESWMPDFMKGLADGINNNKYLIERAVSGVAKEMSMNMTFDTDKFGTAHAGTINNYYTNDNSRTVNQTNTSPKSLSRVDIYRQSKNLLSTVKR